MRVAMATILPVLSVMGPPESLGATDAPNSSDLFFEAPRQ